MTQDHDDLFYVTEVSVMMLPIKVIYYSEYDVTYRVGRSWLTFDELGRRFVLYSANFLLLSQH